MFVLVTPHCDKRGNSIKEGCVWVHGLREILVYYDEEAWQWGPPALSKAVRM